MQYICVGNGHSGPSREMPISICFNDKYATFYKKPHSDVPKAAVFVQFELKTAQRLVEEYAFDKSSKFYMPIFLGKKVASKIEEIVRRHNAEVPKYKKMFKQLEGIEIKEMLRSS